MSAPTKEQVAAAYTRLYASIGAATAQKESRILVFTADLLTLLQKAEDLSFQLESLKK